MFLTNLSLGGDEARPSFFELIAQNKLYDGLKPALKALLNVFTFNFIFSFLKKLQFLAERNENLAPLLERADELFYGLMLYLETHYIHEYSKHDFKYIDSNMI